VLDVNPAHREPRVLVGQPNPASGGELASLARASRRLHRPWVYLPLDARGWRPYLERCRTGAVIAYLLREGRLLASLPEDRGALARSRAVGAHPRGLAALNDGRVAKVVGRP